MQETEKLSRFEEAILPHLDAAHNLARWLVRNDHDAEDIVQEACMRALKYFSAYRGENSRAWLLTIVRNTGYDWLKQNRPKELVTVSDEDQDSETVDPVERFAKEMSNPETLLLQRADEEMLKKVLEELPAEFREVMILREIEEMSYKEIAGICNIPIGTVMSRLARGRKQLQQCLAEWEKQG
jgi:RNA polymerase sigma-70 factor (ECF subfamily)